MNRQLMYAQRVWRLPSFRVGLAATGLLITLLALHPLLPTEVVDYDPNAIFVRIPTHVPPFAEQYATMRDAAFGPEGLTHEAVRGSRMYFDFVDDVALPHPLVGNSDASCPQPKAFSVVTIVAGLPFTTLPHFVPPAVEAFVGAVLMSVEVGEGAGAGGREKITALQDGKGAVGGSRLRIANLGGELYSKSDVVTVVGEGRAVVPESGGGGAVIGANLRPSYLDRSVRWDRLDAKGTVNAFAGGDGVSSDGDTQPVGIEDVREAPDVGVVKVPPGASCGPLARSFFAVPPQLLHWELALAKGPEMSRGVDVSDSALVAGVARGTSSGPLRRGQHPHSPGVCVLYVGMELAADGTLVVRGLPSSATACAALNEQADRCRSGDLAGIEEEGLRVKCGSLWRNGVEWAETVEELLDSEKVGFLWQPLEAFAIRERQRQLAEQLAAKAADAASVDPPRGTQSKAHAIHSPQVAARVAAAREARCRWIAAQYQQGGQNATRFAEDLVQKGCVPPSLMQNSARRMFRVRGTEAPVTDGCKKAELDVQHVRNSVRRALANTSRLISSRQSRLGHVSAGRFLVGLTPQQKARAQDLIEALNTVLFGWEVVREVKLVREGRWYLTEHKVVARFNWPASVGG